MKESLVRTAKGFRGNHDQYQFGSRLFEVSRDREGVSVYEWVEGEWREVYRERGKPDYKQFVKRFKIFFNHTLTMTKLYIALNTKTRQYAEQSLSDSAARCIDKYFRHYTTMLLAGEPSEYQTEQRHLWLQDNGIEIHMLVVGGTVKPNTPTP